ncbi:MAG: LysE family transporter [Glaciecola sp.]|jgi:RhtB (resistance to homoserine/threonine) family protein
MSIWIEFGSIALVHLLAVASPGPDYAVVFKSALTQSRLAAIATSIGIGVGILIHVSYSLLGLNLLFSQYPMLYQGMLILAAVYLAYIGVQALRAKAMTTPLATEKNVHAIRPSSLWPHFRLGLLTNGLNPKASLFFLSLFTVVISPETSLWIKSLYGVYLSVATMVWFCALSVLLTHRSVQRKLYQYSHIIDRVMGIILIVLALSLLWNY